MPVWLGYHWLYIPSCGLAAFNYRTSAQACLQAMDLYLHGPALDCRRG